MYKDIISYELADGVTETHLLEVAQKVYDSWMNKQAGFQGWEIHTNADGSYTDIVYWESKDAAKVAEKDMMNIPDAGAWFACYKEGSITYKNLSRVARLS